MVKDDENWREEISRRMRAARAYAGLSSVKKLAAKIDEPGLGTSTLYAIEQGRRRARPRDLRAIAQACGLPDSWFEVDFGLIFAAEALRSLGDAARGAPPDDGEA